MKTIKTYSFDCIDLSKPLTTSNVEILNDKLLVVFKRGQHYQYSILDNDTGEILSQPMLGFTAQSVYIAAMRDLCQV